MKQDDMNARLNVICCYIACNLAVCYEGSTIMDARTSRSCKAEKGVISR